MYVDDLKLFTKNVKELENLIQTVRIYSHDIGGEFVIEKDSIDVSIQRDEDNIKRHSGGLITATRNNVK